MTETITIYHNPRCSKSRATLQLLQDKGVDPEVVRYLDSPLSAAQIKLILEQLKLSPRELMRKGESVYKELDLKDASLTDEQLIAAMVNHPILIERPIVTGPKGAAIGRPPENVLAVI